MTEEHSWSPNASASSGGAPAGKPRLLERMRQELRARHYSPRTEKAYVSWTRRFIFFHRTRHPAEMGEAEVKAFLTSLATRGKVSASTQNQALAALLFLYGAVLERELDWMDDIVRAKRPARLPVVLSRKEVSAVLGRLRGTPRLMAALMYGSGLRLLECCCLRIKDIDLARREITVRDGKGGKDRVTVLPRTLVTPLRDTPLGRERAGTADVLGRLVRAWRHRWGSWSA
jgi:site-specific recombinase XerD